MRLHHRLRDGLRDYVVLELHEPLPEGHEPVVSSSAWWLERRLHDLARDESNLRVLKALVHHHGLSRPFGPVSAEQVVRQAALLLSTGLLRLARAPLPERYVAPAFAEKPAELAPEESPTEAPRLRLRVVDDFTEVPLSNVKLSIQLPDASKQQATTDAEGRVDLPNVPPGYASVLSALDGATLADVLSLVGTSTLEPEPPKQQEGGPARTRYLARLVEHRVADGETLESVAEMYELTVDALTQLNWGTTDAKAVQRHLLLDVGCTRRDKHGRFVFTRHDDPGILYIPRPMAVQRLDVERGHVLRVKQVPDAPAFLFSA